jgi:photosystem II stability/assembly factor-like uncharacterized protein
MKAKQFLCVTLALIIISAGVPAESLQRAAAQNYAYQEDFEDGQAQGWSLETGWQVILDGVNHVLQGQGHAWARSNQMYDGDYQLSFRIKLVEGTVHLIYRLNDIGRYFIGFYNDGTYLNKQIWPEEYYSDLAVYSGKHTLNIWHQIEIVGRGDTLIFYVDNQQELEYTDPQPLLAGSFAFETLDGSQAYVDDIKVILESPASIIVSPQGQNNQLPSSTELNWVWTGGPLGGLGYDIRMRPDDPDRMYVTDAWAGVFMSVDGGATWFPSNDGITTRTGTTGDAIPVFSLTIDPNQPDTIWVGTQFTRGIFKSTDGGQTWKKMDSGVVEGEGITFRGFSVDPMNSDIVYAAAELSSWAWSADHMQHIGREFDLTGGVVYKTINGGQSWQAVWRGDNLARYIWINPNNTDVVYISTGFFDREAANSDPKNARPGGEGILKSNDGGKTWAAVNNGLNNLYITSLFMHPKNPDILLAAAGNNQYRQGGGVYLSVDGGATWKNTLKAANLIFEAVEFSISNPSIAYAGNEQAIYRSNDGGLTWQKVTSGQNWGPPGVCAGFPIDFQVDPRDPDRIFANEYGGGNFLSSDGGKTWVDASRGYTGSQVRDVAVVPSQPATVLAAARSGLFISYDGGSQWRGLSYPPVTSMEWNVAVVNPSKAQHLLAATNWYGLAVSNNGGYNWEIIAPLDKNHTGWRAITFTPHDPYTVYAGLGGFYSAGVFDSSMPGGGIYISHDGGASWRASNTQLSQDAHVTSIAVDPLNSSIVYAATANHGLLKSTNSGQEWVPLEIGLPNSRPVLSVAIQPDNANTIFVGVERGAIYKSYDGGISWNHSASGLNPEASVADIVFDPANLGTVYLADQLSGVYRSLDGGKSWELINNGLYSRAVNALGISDDGMHLYAATEGNGVYRLDINKIPPRPADISPTSIPTKASLPTAPTSNPSITTAPPTYVYMFKPTETPTAVPTSKPGLCSSSVIIPFGLLGLAFWHISRKKLSR